MKKRIVGADQRTLLYFTIISLTGLALGMGNEVMSNYFKDAYNVSAFQRGLIEFPREIPGVISIFIIACLSIISDIKISVLAQILSIIGITVLGLFTPPFSIMLVFVFLNSLGMHMFIPLQDSIGISLINNNNQIGKRMGQYKGVSTMFTMLAGIVVFIGFKTNFFSFTSPVKWIFLISAFSLFIAMILLMMLESHHQKNTQTVKKVNFVFRKEYKYYYGLVIMFGVQKQMMFVYGPWVLIELLGKKADTLAVLGIIGAFIGIFFIPALGRWLDRFGIKTMLYIDALSFIAVYLLYGILCTGFLSGFLAYAGLPVLLVYILYIFDKMSMQMGMLRSLYLKSILVKDTDLTPSLTLGMGMDHVVSITCAFLGGLVWDTWGAQYLFFMVSGLSLVNLYIARKVKV